MANDSTKNIFDSLKHDDENTSNPNSHASKKKAEKDFFDLCFRMLVKAAEMRRIFIFYMKKHLENIRIDDEKYFDKRNNIILSPTTITKLTTQVDLEITQEQISKLKEIQQKLLSLLTAIAKKIQTLKEMVQAQRQEILELENRYQEKQKDFTDTWQKNIDIMLNPFPQEGITLRIPLPKEIQNLPESAQYNGFIEFDKPNCKNVLEEIGKAMQADTFSAKNLKGLITEKMQHYVIISLEEIIGSASSNQHDLILKEINHNPQIQFDIIAPIWNLIYHNKTLNEKLINLNNIEQLQAKTELELKIKQASLDDLVSYESVAKKAYNDIGEIVNYVNNNGKISTSTANTLALDSQIDSYSNLFIDISNQLDSIDSIFNQAVEQVSDLESTMNDILSEIEGVAKPNVSPEFEEKSSILIARADEFTNNMQKATDELELNRENKEKHSITPHI